MSTNRQFGLSLDLVNLDYQEPNRNRYESKYYWDELFSLIPAAGFQGIEIPYQPKWDFGGRSGVPLTQYAIETKYGTVEKFRQALKADGIEQIVGVQFDPSLFFSDNLDMYFGAFGHFGEQAIQFAGESGAGILTVTPTAPFGRITGLLDQQTDWKADFVKRTVDLINTLAQKASASGVVLSIKQEYWSLARDTGFDRFFEQLDPMVKRDVDTAHLAIQGIDPVQGIQSISGQIGSVHLTDTAYTDTADAWKDPNPEFPAAMATQVFRDLGMGNLDLDASVDALANAGFDGWYVCSCRQTRDVSRALLRTRRLINKMTNNDKSEVRP